MFVCVACGYLWKEADSPPDECPACTAPKEKYIPYDDRAETMGQTRKSQRMSCIRMQKAQTFAQKILHSHHMSGLPSSGYSVTLRNPK